MKESDWNKICSLIAEELASTEEDIPTPQQTPQERKMSKQYHLTEELQNTPFLTLAQQAVGYLNECQDFPEGRELVKAFLNHQEEMLAQIDSFHGDLESRRVEEVCQVSPQTVEALFQHAKHIQSLDIHMALLALLVLLCPGRGDFWFFLACDFYDSNYQELAEQASALVVALLPEQPEAYILHAMILFKNDHEAKILHLINEATTLRLKHPISPKWELILDSLYEKMK